MSKSNHTISMAFEPETVYRVQGSAEFAVISQYMAITSKDGQPSSILKAIVAQSHRYPNGDVATPVAIMKNVVSQIEARGRHRGRLTPGEEQVLAILQPGFRAVTGDVVFELKFGALLQPEEAHTLVVEREGAEAGDSDEV